MGMIALLTMFLAANLLISNGDAQQFAVQPKSVVQVRGLYAEFQCSSSLATRGYNWYINNQSSDTFSPDEVFVTQLTNSLLIKALEHYNNSVIRCEAILMNYTRILFEDATLKVYAPEPIVTSSTPGAIEITWPTPPESSSIQVCIDVYRRSSNESYPIEALCGINSYTFETAGQSLCDEYHFILTPTNNGSNGTSTGPKPLLFNTTKGTGGFIEVHQESLYSSKTAVFHGEVPECDRPINFEIRSEAFSHPILGGYMRSPLEFDLEDNIKGYLTLTFRYNSGALLTYENLSVSTYDVKKVLVAPGDCYGCVTVSIEFLEGSNGAALIVLTPVRANGHSKPKIAPIIEVVRADEPSVELQVPMEEYVWLVFTLNGQQKPQVSDTVFKGTITVSSGYRSTPHSNSVDIYHTQHDGFMVVHCPEGLSCLLLSYTNEQPEYVDVRTIPDESRSVRVTPSGDLTVVALFTWKEGDDVQDGRLSYIEQFPRNYFSSPATKYIYGQSGFLGGVFVLLVAVLIVMCVVGYRHYKKKKFYDLEYQRIMNGYKGATSSNSDDRNPATSTTGNLYNELPGNQEASAVAGGAKKGNGKDLEKSKTSTLQLLENIRQQDIVPTTNLSGSPPVSPSDQQPANRSNSFDFSNSHKKDSADKTKTATGAAACGAVFNEQNQVVQPGVTNEIAHNTNSYNNLGDLELNDLGKV